MHIASLHMLFLFSDHIQGPVYHMHLCKVFRNPAFWETLALKWSFYTVTFSLEKPDFSQILEQNE